MNLVLDANILVRCVVGRRAAADASAARARGVTLVATVAQLDEAVHVLVRVFGLDERVAAAKLLEASMIMAVIDEREYRAGEKRARDRLHFKAQPDWPTLAAAMSLDGGVWTDDRDFFGVGIPIWSTPNVRFAQAETGW